MIRRIPPIAAFLALLAAAAAGAPKKADAEADALFARYRQALEAQPKPGPREIHLRIDGELPSQGKRGSMQVIRREGPDGKVSFQPGEFTGDDTIKRNVIARYLRAEIEASAEQAKGAQLAITRENYKYAYLGLEDRYGRRVHIFELEPRHRRVGLFFGQIWLDEQTFLPVREYGLLASSPSVFLKDVYFVRDYWLLEGKRILRRVLSSIDVRVVGRAELTIWYETDRYPPPPFPAP